MPLHQTHMKRSLCQTGWVCASGEVECVAARHNKLRYSKSKHAKQQKEDRGRSTSLDIHKIFIFPCPHPQNLIGEGLLARGSFVLLIDHALFT